MDINDVVSAVAPGAKPIIAGGKIIYYSADGTRAVVADVSGYLRVQDLTKKTRKRQYLDQCLLHNKNSKSCRPKMEKVASPFWRMLQLHQNRSL